MHFQEQRGEFEVSTDPSKLDLEAIHTFLSQSPWAQGIPRETVARALHHSLCFGLHEGKRQIGLARLVTDRATYAFLCDVYVLPERRGRGLARWLIDCVMRHPELSGLRHLTLVTRDAHELYRAFGFGELAEPGSYMEIVRRGIYQH